MTAVLEGEYGDDRRTEVAMIRDMEQMLRDEALLNGGKIYIPETLSDYPTGIGDIVGIERSTRHNRTPTHIGRLSLRRAHMRELRIVKETLD